MTDGTRFRLFPQPPAAGRFDEPETVVLPMPAGSVGPGPSDDRVYVIDPIGKTHPYGTVPDGRGGERIYVPPWQGPMAPAAMPDAEGHFDHLAVGTPEFEAAHIYGVVRWTLDIWQRYFGRRVDWHFAQDFDRMEIVLLRHLNNATMGYGFMEIGAHHAENGEVLPFSTNFDVVAHEVGHCIIYAEIGIPNDPTDRAEYYGFHESAADIISLIASMHFNSVVDDLLEQTRGNLYTFNTLNRLSEFSEFDQIRVIANPLTMWDFADGWPDEHTLAQPLNGALFDTLVDIFHEELVDRGLISERSEDLSDRLEGDPDYANVVQPIFDAAYGANPHGFKQALLDARDTMGTYLAHALTLLPTNFLAYTDVAEALLRVDQAINGGRYRSPIEVNFAKRGIGLVDVGPRIAEPQPGNHFDSARTVVPEVATDRCIHANRRLPYRLRRLLARQSI